MNPIFRREFRARWRDRRSHLLLLALALLLGLAAYLRYETALSASSNIASVTTRGSRAGHALFSILAIGNVGVWFVLAPLLMATGVARERERGLLESLQLSPMRPLSQIVARTLSALSFLAILQLVTLPIYFVAFSFGGVSEEEILRVWEIVAATAFCGIGLGLALSAQSPRPSGALFGAVAFLVVWSILALIGGNYSTFFWWLGLGSSATSISQVLFYGHPVVLVWALCEPADFSSVPLSAWLKSSPEQLISPILLTWGVFGVLGLIKATRDVTRPLPPTGWAGRNTLIQKWKTRREKRLKAQLAKRRSRVSVEGALLADLPFDRLVHFKNPLLNREVKSRFRLRRASAWVWTGRTIIFLVGATIWALVCFSTFFDPPSRPGEVPFLLWSEWFLGTALVGTFAASAFAREREAGTWEGIRLSLMTPREVTLTKWASPLLAFAFLSCPLWLLLFVLLPIGNWNGLPFRWIGLGSLIVISSLCWISALGSWISLRAKNTASAMCWTIGALLAVLVVLPCSVDSLGVARQIALWHYGLNNDLSRSGWDDPQNFALYTWKTGISIQRPYANGINPSPAELQKWARYYDWFEQTDHHLHLYQKKILFWSPIDVLMAFQDRGRQSYDGYGYSSVTLDDETVTIMALLHIALASVGTLVLLSGVNNSLKKQRD